VTIERETSTAATSVHYRTCPLCEATCGLEITMRGDTVVRIRGDRDDVFSRGYLCPKGSTLKQLHEDPDRLRRPVIRRGTTPSQSTWEEVDWDEAFAEVERRLVPLIERHGRDAVAIYLGNPNVHNLAGAIYNRPLIRALGTRNIYSASTVDQMPKHVSSGLLFGSPDAIPVPDLDRTEYLLVLGANPHQSNGSLCTAPDFPGRLRGIRARGGKVVVIDPRRTETADLADEHVFIRPGTDVLFLAAMIHTILRDELVTLGSLADHTTGLEELPTLIEPFGPEAVEPLTGVEAATVRRLAHELTAAPSAAVYGRIGTCTVAFGTLASWAVDVVNILTGNLDRPGGAMFPLAAHARRPSPPGPGRGFVTGRHRSRVHGHPEVRSELPVATLADEIETPGEGQVRALITVAGNPVLSTPNSARLAAALETLELMISVDPYLNETTRHAHVVLPPPSPLARSHYDLAFTGLSVRNIANWSAPIVAPDGPHEHEILARLALIASGQGAGADPAVIDALVLGSLLERATREPELAGTDPAELSAQLQATQPTDRAVEIMIRSGPYGDLFGRRPDGLDFNTLVANPHGIDLGPLQPRIPEILSTPSGRIELVTDPIRADLGRLRSALTDGPETAGLPAADQLLLIGRRHVRSNNSWMHNLEVLVKGKPRCTLLISPYDASRLGLSDGGQATVRSRVGQLTATVEVTDRMMPGVVSLPHGWGHDLPGVRQSVAQARPGVNSNLLTDETRLDPLSGNAVLNGIPVDITPA
jgi:anaerobic selenocysteine-containing dehydrogenase